MDTRTLVLVEGHAGVRAALAARLAHLAPGAVLGTAGTLAEAVRLVQEQAPDVVLCDPRSLGGDSVTTLQTLCATGCPVVVLTTTMRAGEAALLREHGAAAVLLKGAPLADVLQVITRSGAPAEGASVAAAAR